MSPFFYLYPVLPVLSTVVNDADTKLRLEYTSPESLPSPLTGLLQQIDSKSDMWSLGMILHKLLFFKLPYRWVVFFLFD